MTRLAAIAVAAALVLTGCSVKTDADHAREACVENGVNATLTQAEAEEMCNDLSDKRVVELFENGWFDESRS